MDLREAPQPRDLFPVVDDHNPRLGRRVAVLKERLELGDR